MTTQETAQLTKTEFFVEYVYNNSEFYYQLVRTSDLAIMFANSSLENIFLNCWHQGISKDKVTIW